MRTLVVFYFLLFISTAAAGTCPVRDVSFDQFYSRFSKDKAFSITRTIYPLMVTQPDSVCEQTWKPNAKCREVANVTKIEDSNEPTIVQIMARDGRLSAVSLDGSSKASVSIYGPDSDWVDAYKFKLIKGCWYLTNIDSY